MKKDMLKGILMALSQEDCKYRKILLRYIIPKIGTCLDDILKNNLLDIISTAGSLHGKRYLIDKVK